MPKPTLILAFQPTPEVRHEIGTHFHVIENTKRTLTSDEIVALANEHGAAAILVSVEHKLHDGKTEALPASVKVIATSSVGFDHFDREAAKEKGIVLTNTPGVLTDCTADLGFLLLLNVTRRAREYLEVMESGWPRNFAQGEMLGRNLGGKKLGILGMGAIGRGMAARAKAFGMEIHYTNRNRLSPELENGATFHASFLELLPHCDAISLHAPATTETRHIMNAEAFGLMKKGSILVNVARGSLVDENALINALESGHLFGAGLDVFEKEPEFDKRLLKFPNVFLTPHMGSATVETRNAMGRLALENMLAVLSGKPAITAV